MKNITKILNSNPALAKELAKLLAEELEVAAEAAPEVLHTNVTDEVAGTNDAEVVAEAPATEPITSGEVAGEGHSIVAELTAEDPISAEQVDALVDEIPAEELEGEVEALEDVAEQDAEKVEELEGVVKEATDLIAQIKQRIVFTESVINKVNARILTEAAKVLRNKTTLTESKK